MRVRKSVHLPLGLFLVAGISFRAFLSTDSLAYAKDAAPLLKKTDQSMSLDLDPPIVKRDYWTELLGTASLVSSLEKVLLASSWTAAAAVPAQQAWSFEHFWTELSSPLSTGASLLTSLENVLTPSPSNGSSDSKPPAPDTSAVPPPDFSSKPDPISEPSPTPTPAHSPAPSPSPVKKPAAAPASSPARVSSLAPSTSAYYPPSISRSEFDSRLNEINNRLSAEILSLRSIQDSFPRNASLASSVAAYNYPSLTTTLSSSNAFDPSGITINSSTWNGGRIGGAAISGGTISGVTISDSTIVLSSGTLSASSLSISGAATFSTTLAVAGDTTLSGLLSAGTTTVTSLISTNTSTSTFAGGISSGVALFAPYANLSGNVYAGGIISGGLVSGGCGVFANGVNISGHLTATTMTASGKVGLNGTTSPWGMLSIEHTSGVVPFAVGSSTATSFVIDAYGRVGIGTSSPVVTSKLTVNGAIYAPTYVTGLADLAERYPTDDDTLVPGEIVALDPNHAGSIKRAATGDKALFGILSSAPGVILGGGEGKAVALTGRIPTKVNMEGGAIEIGDRIALSSVAGVGKKAGAGDESVGVALESYSGAGASLISVFAENRQYVGLGASASASDGAPFASVLTGLENLGAKFSAGVANFISVIADKVTAHEVVTNKLTVKNEADISKTGIVMYDRATGEPSCVYVEGGVVKNTAGTCDPETSPAVSPSPSPSLSPELSPSPSPSADVSPSPSPSSQTSEPDPSSSSPVTE